MITVGAGIKRVVARKRYHAAQETRKLFENAGVEMAVIEDNVMNYENQ
jgi:dCMP deaminase